MTPRLKVVRIYLIFKIGNQILNCIDEGKLQCLNLREINYFGWINLEVFVLFWASHIRHNSGVVNHISEMFWNSVTWEPNNWEHLGKKMKEVEMCSLRVCNCLNKFRTKWGLNDRNYKDTNVSTSKEKHTNLLTTGNKKIKLMFNMAESKTWPSTLWMASCWGYVRKDFSIRKDFDLSDI